MTLGTTELIQKLQVIHVLVLTGKTVEQVSCLVPQSVIMIEFTDKSESEEIPFQTDPPTPAADPEPVRSQSRRLPARKIIFWSLIVIVVFFLVAGCSCDLAVPTAAGSIADVKCRKRRNAYDRTGNRQCGAAAGQ